MSAAAKRYAVALIATAREENALDAVEADLQALSRLLDASEEFRSFVAHPLIEPDDQRKALDALFGSKAHKLSANLLAMLVERERLADLPDVVREAVALLKEEKGILPVKVVSAVPLQASQRKDLEARLTKRTGKTIELHCSEDPALIGGFRLQIGDMVEDYSLSTKLDIFKQNVLNA